MADVPDRDTPVKIPLDPLDAIRAILKVDPNSDPADQAEVIDEDDAPA